MKRFLPIGSVVLLKGGQKNLMITGFCLKTPETGDQLFDYCGCLYPEGIINTDENALFNHDQINQVLAMGFSNEEEKAYRAQVIEFSKQQDSKK